MAPPGRPDDSPIKEETTIVTHDTAPHLDEPVHVGAGVHKPLGECTRDDLLRAAGVSG